MSKAKAQARSTVSAVLRHADGTVEDLGVVSINGKPATWFRKFVYKMKGAFHG